MTLKQRSPFHCLQKGALFGRNMKEKKRGNLLFKSSTLPPKAAVRRGSWVEFLPEEDE